MEPRKEVTLDDIERRLVLEYGEKRYNWHRQLVTLSSGGLTLLVSFQSNYVPEHPDFIIFLKLCWGALAISILSGVLALVGAAQTPLDLAVSLRRRRESYGDGETVRFLNETNGIPQRERIPYQVAERLLVGSFVLALLSLSVFAILNIGNFLK